MLPPFQGDHLAQNNQLVKSLTRLDQAVALQLLAWVLAQGDEISRSLAPNS